MIDSVRIIEEPAYRDCEIKHYRGNPLIEALPPIMAKEEAARQLAWLPELPSEEDRSLPGHVRLHYISTIRQFAVPLPEYLAFEPIISMTLRGGYARRNPSLMDTWKKIYQTNLRNQDVSALPSPSESSHSILFSGISGTGKTTFINRVLSTYPQVIQHTQYKGENLRVRQLVWLKVDCPADCTPKAMSKNFLAAVDRVLMTDYSEVAKNSRHNGTDLLLQMQSIAQNNFLGVLILDELHHLRAAKSGGDDRLLDALAALFNIIEVPIIGIGTPDVTQLFSKKLQNVRRAASNGAYEFRLPTGPNDEAWSHFIHTLWPYQWLRKPNKLTKKLNEAFFRHSHGITFFAAALFMLCQYRLVLDEGDERITTDLLEQIAAEELAPLQPALRVLRSGQEEQMRVFEDLLPHEGWVNDLLDPGRIVLQAMKRPGNAPAAKKKTNPHVRTDRAARAETAKSDPADLRNMSPDSSGHAQAQQSGYIPVNPFDFGSKPN